MEKPTVESINAECEAIYANTVRVSTLTEKPLRAKNYGSIPHLPKSRLGPGDHSISPGQSWILTEKARDAHDIIFVHEKLDGANTGVARHNGEILALSRSGKLCANATYEHLRAFDGWVKINRKLFDWLEEGERVCGEWLAMAHGTRYTLPHAPFVVFDLMKGSVRSTQDAMDARIDSRLTRSACLHKGGPLSITEALKRLGKFGFHGATEPVEGVVYRVERNGQVDFLAKFVQHWKQDGKYLENPVWNCDVSEWLKPWKTINEQDSQLS
jgi:hypothetical protein